MNLGQIYTKKIVADYMVSMFTLPSKATIIDPCFGHGVFIESLIHSTDYLIEGTEIDVLSYNAYKNPNSSRCKLYCKDFFTLEINNHDGYDGVIMNPPYIRHEEIEQLSVLGVSKKHIRNKCQNTSIASQANMYMYFILYAISLLKHGGEMIVIIPNTWMKTINGRKFHNAIMENCSIDQYITVKGKPFEQNPMVDVVILKICKQLNITTTYKKIFIQDNCIRTYDDDVSDVYINNHCVKLSQYVKIRRGITTGCNSIFINPLIRDKSLCQNIVCSPKSITGFSTKNAAIDEILMIQSHTDLPKEIESYLKLKEASIINSNKPQTLLAKIKNNKPWYIINTLDIGVIIFPYIIRSKIKFILNSDDLLARDNFYTIKTSIDSLLMMALLNNYYIYRQLELIGKTYGNGVLKIQKYDMDNLLIVDPRIISTPDKGTLINLSNELIKTQDDVVIGKISTVLEKYYGYDNAKLLYIEMRNKRLKR